MSQGVVAPAVRNQLASGRLGVWGVMFFVLSAATPLTVVAGVVTNGYAVTGLRGIPIAFLAIGVVLFLFAVGFVSMARRVANAGAFYTYVAHGLGRPAGVGAAWLALASYNSLQAGLYGTIGAAAAPVLHRWLDVEVPWWVVALVAWAIVAVLGQLHVDVNSRVLAALLVAEVVIIAVYSGADFANPAGGSVSAATLDPGSLIDPGVGALLAIAVLGFVGIEATVVFSEESRDPHRTVRVATYLSVGILAVLYAGASWAMSVATGPDQIVTQSQTLSVGLIFQLAGTHLGTTIVYIGQALFVTSVLAAMIAFHNTSARYAFALGRERVLPRFFERTSRTDAPIYGSLAQTIIGLVAIVVFAHAGWDPVVHLFYWGGATGALGVLALIATTSVAVVVFFARHPAGEPVWRRAVAPALAAAATGTVFALALTNFDILLGVPPDSLWRWGIPAALGGLAVLGLGWGLLLKRRRPAIYAAIGLGAHSITSRHTTTEGACP